MFLRQKNLFSVSNESLRQFKYGINKDNALTYTIRTGDRQVFQYLLTRGLTPLASDADGKNAIHYAVMHERVDFLTFLLTGQFEGQFRKIKPLDFDEKPFLKLAWEGLDRLSVNEGVSPLHIACANGNKEILRLIIRHLKHRDTYQPVYSFIGKFKSLQTHLEQTTVEYKTPFLVAASSNNHKIMKILLKRDVEQLYSQCRLLKNALHYAVQLGNPQMIKFVLSADAENNYLRQQVDCRGKPPSAYNPKQSLTHIWDLCAGSASKDAIVPLL